MEKNESGKQILIAGSSNEMVGKIEKEKRDDWNLKYITAFFENSNFLITKYRPLTMGVHLILEMEDGTELHIEGANCGYYGTGPITTVDILKLFGIETKLMEELIYLKEAVRIELEDGQVCWGKIDTSYIFYPMVKENGRDKSQYNKICRDNSVSVNLEKRKLMFYNPHKNCWNGFQNLLSYMENVEFEYYIGPNSFLEGGLYIDKEIRRKISERYGNKKTDFEGIEHVNLVLNGSNFSIVCLIDRRDEMHIIEAIYFSMTKRRLFQDMQYDFSTREAWKFFLRTLRKQKKELYEKKEIQKRSSENGGLK